VWLAGGARYIKRSGDDRGISSDGDHVATP